MNTEILVNIGTAIVSVITIGAFSKRILENMLVKLTNTIHLDISNIRIDISDIRKDLTGVKKDIDDLRSDMKSIKEDSKAQSLRTDKLYEMFISLLQSQKKTKSEK